ncbi:MAG TPA: ATP-binding cassette domain-containing protein [Terriglobia bacterium]|jgi:putative ABC transport system ATP-binding protein
MSGESPILHVDGLSHYFGEGGARRRVLFDNRLKLDAGEIAILTGPSGSGKTTLLTLAGALRSIQEGSIRVFGHELNGLAAAARVRVRREIGFIFQLHNLFESLTAFENVMMALELKPSGRPEMRRQAGEMLERLGLGKRIDAKPEAMSGGQRQRVSIARALINRPRLILADEPTAALDKDSGREVIQLLQELARQRGCAILIVTHDNRILDAADRIINMVDGRIFSDVQVAESVRICEFLTKCRVFSSLSATGLSDIADKVLHEWTPSGAPIVRQGDQGDKFYIIRSGSAAVYREEGGQKVLVATLGEGEFFGEAALVTGEPRNATVMATTDTELYTLGKEDFHIAIEASPTFKEQLLRILFQRQ